MWLTLQDFLILIYPPPVTLYLQPLYLFTSSAHSVISVVNKITNKRGIKPL
ncbi:hypothetical protein PISS_a0510 [Pseudoalteromonas issachenkonii]|uniref:Uncharacterized protein n=1 Tax=Pseudoalteromonas issachenkonii TaxID=152297 RepID=A0ABM6N041_9GAMM|nr:hypothetical protein PISS_a0510 [Pseudoalteromonas issachenkonii]